MINILFQVFCVILYFLSNIENRENIFFNSIHELNMFRKAKYYIILIISYLKIKTGFRFISFCIIEYFLDKIISIMQ